MTATPELKAAGKVSITELLKRIGDPKVEMTREVPIPEMGITAKIKRCSPQDEMILLAKTREPPQPQLDEQYGLKTITDDRARGMRWTIIWTLHLCCLEPTFTVKEAVSWFGRDDGSPVIDRLYGAIWRLNNERPPIPDDAMIELLNKFPQAKALLKAIDEAGAWDAVAKGDEAMLGFFASNLNLIAAVQESNKQESAEKLATEILKLHREG